MITEEVFIEFHLQKLSRRRCRMSRYAWNCLFLYTANWSRRISRRYS